MRNFITALAQFQYSVDNFELIVWQTSVSVLLIKQTQLKQTLTHWVITTVLDLTNLKQKFEQIILYTNGIVQME